jgi:hypothetical protein
LTEKAAGFFSQTMPTIKMTTSSNPIKIHTAEDFSCFITASGD